ncbi:MAG TPA: O-antigen ligase family protein [Bryobacteraceae bacterium]|jgi:O-antigen ligase|nr:O-antigen ligase family protein [Bryobacteraceae bacterium]
MSPSLAEVFFLGLILALFWLDRNRQSRVSPLLWIPVLWFLIACSRPVSEWIEGSSSFASAEEVADGSPMDRLIFTGFLLLGIAILALRSSKVLALLRSNASIVLFFLYCALSLLWSDFPDVGFKRLTKAIGDLVMILIVLSEPEPLAAIERLIARTAYLLIPLSVLLIKYFPDLGVQYSPWGGKPDYRGVTANKNSLGCICLCLGLGLVWRLIAAYRNRDLEGRKRHMAALCLTLGMILYLFRIANSMTSLNTFVMASLLLLAANLRRAIRRPVIVHVLVLAMLAVSASVVFLGASPDVLRAMGRNPTLTDRTEVWGVLLTLVQNPLLGTGFETFWLGPRLAKMWDLYWWRPNEAHNGYLEIYINLGWVGIALLAIVILVGYQTVFRAWRRNPAIASLFLAYFFVGLVFNFTEAAFFRMQAPAWMFFLLAITRWPKLPAAKAQVPTERVRVPQETLACSA